jgi:deoxyribodipyrimidine photo-lyase
MQSGVTGINALRIYNPIKQSQEHDRTGAFIKRWLPELRNVSSTWVHEPSKMDLPMQRKAQCIIGTDYPEPIVNQIQAAKSARAKIKASREQQGYKEKAQNIHKKLGSRKRPHKKKKRTSTVTSQLLLDLQ